MVSYTLKAGRDGQLHTEGWKRWSATHRSCTVSRHRRAKRWPREPLAEGVPMSTRTGTTF